MRNVFYIPENARWNYLVQNAKQDDIAIKIDIALRTVEKSNPVLKGALPDWSPDGSKIYFTSDRTGQNEGGLFYVIPERTVAINLRLKPA